VSNLLLIPCGHDATEIWMPPVFFRLTEDVLSSVSQSRRRDLELALVELNEDALGAGLGEQSVAIVLGRGPQGGIALERDGVLLPLGRKAFEDASTAYAQAMERVSRACAVPLEAQNLQRLDEAKGRIHLRGATLVREAVAAHHTLDDLVARRLFTVAFLIVRGARASRVLGHASDLEPS
jgi:hypothetical protein